MLTQKQIDDILNDSRYADEGPTKLARRFEAAGVAEERERCAALDTELQNVLDWAREEKEPLREQEIASIVRTLAKYRAKTC